MRIKSGGRSDAPGWACTYRFFNAVDRLLYVGVADDHDVRWAGHVKRSWWPDVVRKEVIWFECRLDALYEESRAIATEHPIHNRKPGLSPVGLMLIRFLRMGRLTPIDDPWLAVTRWDKDEAFRYIAHGRAHGRLTYEGEPGGLVIPIDWYLRACERMGQPVNLAAMPQLHWEDL